MEQIIIGNSVQGASHKRTNTECQDSFHSRRIGKSLIVAVADGHGSKSCPFSKAGSDIAISVFIKTMNNLYKSYETNLEQMMSYLNRDGAVQVAKKIHSEWKNRVLTRHSEKQRDIPTVNDGKNLEAEILKQYGTTLVGALITPLFIFSFQIGDGDIVYVHDSKIEMLLEQEKILGTETHSLSKTNGWENAVSSIYRNDIEESLPAMIMLTTDGFANSFKNVDEYHKTCVEYLNMINQYGIKEVQANLKDWLNETSEQGCGDDITVEIVYFQ
ncbi:PP2C family serine/threonine-protein phosphatase [Ruminococcus sp.]|uniref:PP2C family serine/threonine-protein phosphatase n=1 Tax=Ruminococcus sp. TaxID=41978 RepID=UPI002586DE9E|nr:PP2C family serine/threonine-protein phosphatase [Ruminococcus sp.]MCR5019712.1 protein phosphatase 2C domain-containing protein [Ruminococcus sp.]